jgi:hypothetical protein
MSYTSLTATLSLKTATTINPVAKVGHSSTKTQNPWYHSIDTKHYFHHVKFEMRFVISFMSKFMFDKKGRFARRNSRDRSKKVGISNRLKGRTERPKRVATEERGVYRRRHKIMTE